MEIQELQSLYATHPQLKAFAAQLGDESVCTVFLGGLCASAAPLLFSALPLVAPRIMQHPFLFLLDDAEEAGYFYHDLTQILGENQVFYFPSSYRRAIKFAQRDAANEILRTEVLSRIAWRAPALYRNFSGSIG